MNITKSRRIWQIVAASAVVALAGAGAVGVASAKERPARPSRPSKAQAIADAQKAIGGHRQGLRAAGDEKFTARSVAIDKDGSRHVRFARTFKGLKVLGGDSVIHSAPAGEFRSATVAQSQPIAVDTKPSVGKAAAIATAVKKFRGKRTATTAELVVDAASGAPALTWRAVVRGTASSGVPSSLNVLVDARTGAVRRSFDDIHAAEGTGHGLYAGTVPLDTTEKPDGSFALVDPVRGTETRDALRSESPTRADGAVFTDADNDWGTGAAGDKASMAADVHYGLRKAWDYWERVHGRHGTSDDGKGPLAFVDYGTQSEANAYWDDDCECVAFGAGAFGYGPFTSLEVVGHELAHGVTSATANLEYAGESGGLNEATSDIFGTLVEWDAHNANEPGDYVVGGRRGDKPLRFMDQPDRDGQSLSCWRPGIATAAVDPHYSSGIANKFFYQLAVGSGKSQWGDSPTCGTAPAVTGLGNEKAGAIWYRALNLYMVYNTTFAGARAATLAAAADLYGAGSREQQTVDAAWKAVNVDGSDPVPPTPDAPHMDRIRPPVVRVGAKVSLQVRAVDPQRQRVTFVATGLPPGLAISPSGLIGGVVSTKGRYEFTVTASDPDGHASSQSAVWWVEPPPGEDVDVVASIDAPQEVPLGGSADITVRASSWQEPTRYKAGLSLDRRLTITAVKAPGWIVDARADTSVTLHTDPARPMTATPDPIAVTVRAVSGPTAIVKAVATAELGEGMGTDWYKGNNSATGEFVAWGEVPVHGTVWDDRNADRLRNDGEPGVQGAKVSLFQQRSRGQWTAAGEATTASDGTYALPPIEDKYYVRIEVVTPGAGWAFTTPGDPHANDDYDSDVVPVDGDPSRARSGPRSFGTKPLQLDAGLVRKPTAPVPPTTAPPVPGGPVPPTTAPPAPGGAVPPPTSPVTSPPAPGSGGSLPVTGESLTGLLAAGVLLAGGGFALIVMARRRRTR